MRKSCIGIIVGIILLIGIDTTDAKWTPIANNPQGDTYYFEDTSIKREGDLISGEFNQSYVKPKLSNGIYISSTSIRIAYNPKTNRFWGKFLCNYGMDNKAIRDNKIHNWVEMPSEYYPVVIDSIRYILLNN